MSQRCSGRLTVGQVSVGPVNKMSKGKSHWPPPVKPLFQKCVLEPSQTYIRGVIGTESTFKVCRENKDTDGPFPYACAK